MASVPGHNSALVSLIPTLPSLNNTYGAVLLGSYFGVMLYGFNMHQAYRYSRIYRDDNMYLKVLVVAVLILETFHTALCMHMSYYYLANNYFNPIALLSGSWSIDMLPISAGLVIIACQTFFVRRVYLVGRQFKHLVYLVVVLLFCELAFCAAATAEAFIQPTFATYEHVTWLISVGFGVAVVADGILTTALIVALRRNRTGIRRTDSVVDVLVLYAVTTGLLTTVFNTLAFLFALIQPNNLIYVGINIVASKMYATSLFAALNTRQALAQQGFGASTAIYGGGRRGSTAPHATVSLDQWRVAQVPPNGTSETALAGTELKSERPLGFEGGMQAKESEDALVEMRDGTPRVVASDSERLA
ncbi:hypothetical protein BD413DRAFT_294423 [Trametes elegans]|nr:hypothetical protein BD413DRAFT_294423 [Trametes elegans]